MGAARRSRVQGCFGRVRWQVLPASGAQGPALAPARLQIGTTSSAPTTLRYGRCSTIPSSGMFWASTVAGTPSIRCAGTRFGARPTSDRDYFQRSNDPEVWALLDDPEFRDVLGEYGGRYSQHPVRRDPLWRPPDFRSGLLPALQRP